MNRHEPKHDSGINGMPKLGYVPKHSTDTKVRTGINTYEKKTSN